MHALLLLGEPQVGKQLVRGHAGRPQLTSHRVVLEECVLACIATLLLALVRDASLVACARLCGRRA